MAPRLNDNNDIVILQSQIVKYHSCDTRNCRSQRESLGQAPVILGRLDGCGGRYGSLWNGTMWLGLDHITWWRDAGNVVRLDGGNAPRGGAGDAIATRAGHRSGSPVGSRWTVNSVAAIRYGRGRPYPHPPCFFSSAGKRFWLTHPPPTPPTSLANFVGFFRPQPRWRSWCMDN